MANNLEANYKLFEALGLVLLGKIEDELVSLGYETSRLVRQTLRSQPWLQPDAIEQSVRSHTENLFNQLPDATLPDADSFFSRLTQLTDQFAQRDQTIASLEARIACLEEYIAQQRLVNEPTSLPQEPAILDSRLTAIEDSLDSIDLLATELGHRGAATAALDSRVTKLEATVQEVAHKSDSNQSVDHDTLMRVVEGDRTI